MTLLVENYSASDSERRVNHLICLGKMSAEGEIVKLVSSDQETFEVERGVATISNLVSHVLEDVGEDEKLIPIPNVEARILAKVIEYCRYHHQLQTNPQADEDVEKWDKEFVRVDKPTLFSLILAANYLDIQALLDLTCKTIADMIKGKSAEQIRSEFGIENDFTPEEEEEIKRENAWVEER
uniref:E3 ubiquitin ligase complex SCF subunit n=1 Tax=Timspurckia oligopyrenoides TaxID=708627 RepID=A0A7S0ZFH6_9RHOD|mmetsp:Transcript_3292/g.5771  ORF Transcript_3292/g.5771 Transcript_3292/m.5771 type:complete len:182 (+) Transcript_3292:19-564(+)